MQKWADSAVFPSIFTAFLPFFQDRTNEFRENFLLLQPYSGLKRQKRVNPLILRICPPQHGGGTTEQTKKNMASYIQIFLVFAKIGAFNAPHHEKDSSSRRPIPRQRDNGVFRHNSACCWRPPRPRPAPARPASPPWPPPPARQ